jgi:hypothetical protein
VEEGTGLAKGKEEPDLTTTVKGVMERFQ